MKLKDFGIIIRTIGIIYLFILLIDNRVTIPLSIIVLVTVGYLCSAISCTAKLFSPSMKHHKIVNYFIDLLGIIIIIKNFRIFNISYQTLDYFYKNQKFNLFKIS